MLVSCVETRIRTLRLSRARAKGWSEEDFGVRGGISSSTSEC